MEMFWQSLAGLIVVAGPWKAMLVFAERTTPMTKPTRRGVALVGVASATGIGLVFIFLGEPLVDLFHIKPAAFLIAAGLIVLVFSIKMVLTEGHEESSRYASEEEAGMRFAIYPLAMPLLITPVSIAALTAMGTDAAVNDEALLAVVAALLIVMVFNLAVLLAESELEQFVPVEVWRLAEKALGVLLAAFGASVIIDGLELLDIVKV